MVKPEIKIIIFLSTYVYYFQTATKLVYKYILSCLDLITQSMALLVISAEESIQKNTEIFNAINKKGLGTSTESYPINVSFLLDFKFFLTIDPPQNSDKSRYVFAGNTDYHSQPLQFGGAL